ncbi:MAG: F0F1 ATP synthase subunit B [Elusimicrobia bacterium]|nr:F0F1 ATP synthase subunit B [Elusimicrobiota bacterium]
MEKLLSPDIGLSIWTAVAFLLLVVILGKVAWKPIIQALEEREHALKAEREATEAARRSAEELKAVLDRELAKVQQRTQEMLAEAQKEGAAQRESVIRAAQEEAARLTEKTRAQLEGEKNRLVQDLRKEVAGLSTLAAEKILRKSIDASVQKTALDEFFRDLEKNKTRLES